MSEGGGGAVCCVGEPYREGEGKEWSGRSSGTVGRGELMVLLVAQHSPSAHEEADERER